MKNLYPRQGFVLLHSGFSKFRGSNRTTLSASPFIKMYFMIEGEGNAEVNGMKYSLQCGNIYIVPPFATYDVRVNGQFSFYYVYFFEKIPSFESLFMRYEFPFGIPGDKLSFGLAERLRDVSDEIRSGVQANGPQWLDLEDEDLARGSLLLECHGMLLQLLALFLRASSPKPPLTDERIQKSLEYIDGNIYANISVTSLAVLVRMSEDKYRRLFKNETGQTPLKYINRKKVERASLLLLTTELTVHEISSMLMLGNLSYFNRLFKSFNGLTPGQYRDRYFRVTLFGDGHGDQITKF